MQDEIIRENSYEDIEKMRGESQGRLKGAWESILEKYSQSFPHSDIIDLVTGEIVEDKGHLRHAPISNFGMGSDGENEECLDDFSTPAAIEPVCWQSGDDEPDFKAIYAQRKQLRLKKEKVEQASPLSNAKPFSKSPMRVMDLNTISPSERKELFKIDSIDLHKVIYFSSDNDQNKKRSPIAKSIRPLTHFASPTNDHFVKTPTTKLCTPARKRNESKVLCTLESNESSGDELCDASIDHLSELKSNSPIRSKTNSIIQEVNRNNATIKYGEKMERKRFSISQDRKVPHYDTRDLSVTKKSYPNELVNTPKRIHTPNKSSNSNMPASLRSKYESPQLFDLNTSPNAGKANTARYDSPKFKMLQQSKILTPRRNSLKIRSTSHLDSQEDIAAFKCSSGTPNKRARIENDKPFLYDSPSRKCVNDDPNAPIQSKLNGRKCSSPSTLPRNHSFKPRHEYSNTVISESSYDKPVSQLRSAHNRGDSQEIMRARSPLNRRRSIQHDVIRSSSPRSYHRPNRLLHNRHIHDFDQRESRQAALYSSPRKSLGNSADQFDNYDPYRFNLRSQEYEHSLPMYNSPRTVSRTDIYQARSNQIVNYNENLRPAYIAERVINYIPVEETRLTLIDYRHQDFNDTRLIRRGRLPEPQNYCDEYDRDYRDYSE